MSLLDLSKHTQAIQVRDRETAAALRLVENAINHMAKSSGSSPIGEPSAPSPIQQLDVKVSGETAHATITDNSPLTRNIHYFLEYATEPQFLAPHIEHLGTSRGRIINLPTNGDDGTPQNYYFRAYSQYPSSKPSEKVTFGQSHAPTPVVMQGVPTNGGTNMTLLPSTGSGTAAGNGQQGGFGFGKFQNRPAVLPKRSVGTNAGR